MIIEAKNLSGGFVELTALAIDGDIGINAGATLELTTLNKPHDIFNDGDLFDAVVMGQIVFLKQPSQVEMTTQESINFFLLRSGEFTGAINFIKTTVPIPGAAIVTTTINYQDAVAFWLSQDNPPIQLTPVVTVDFDNTSSLGPNLIDGDYDNRCYNNLSIGSANKTLPAIDYGSSILISDVYVYWDRANRICTTFRIQWSDDGVSWNETGDIAGVWPGADEIPQIVNINVTARYVRIKSIVGVNGNWFNVAEMEAYQNQGTTTKTLLYSSPDFTIGANASGLVTITSNIIQDAEIDIIHV